MSSARLARDLFAVDIGNSKVEAVAFRGGRRLGRWRLDYGDLPAALWMRSWRAALLVARDAGAPLAPALVASVSPQRAARLLPALRAAGWRPHLASWRDPWPFQIDVDAPRGVGVDRLANVAGLVALGHRRGVALDVGTAVTFDVLRDGRFEGGLIVPGFELAARSLHEHTALLPLVDPFGPAALLGRDTGSAIRAGVRQVTLYGLLGVARAILAELGRGARMVTTGSGGAEVVAAFPAGLAEHVPELQLLGLRTLAPRLHGASRRPSGHRRGLARGLQASP